MKNRYELGASRRVLTQLRRPLAVPSTVPLEPLIPFAHNAYRVYTSRWPEDDRRVLADPEVEAIFVDDMVNAFHGRCLAMVGDARLLGGTGVSGWPT
jgi:hypothetical protein